MAAEYLQYYIRETRQQAISRRDQQQEEMLDYLKGLLAKALHSGQTVALPPLVWHLAATATPERMQALLWYRKKRRPAPPDRARRKRRPAPLRGVQGGPTTAGRGLGRGRLGC